MAAGFGSAAQLYQNICLPWRDDKTAATTPTIMAVFKAEENKQTKKKLSEAPKSTLQPTWQTFG